MDGIKIKKDEQGKYGGDSNRMGCSLSGLGGLERVQWGSIAGCEGECPHCTLSQ